MNIDTRTWFTAQSYDIMTESLNELGFSIAENLTAYSLIRTFTIIRTIKSISEDIIGKDRTTLIKNIQRLKEIEDLLYNQLELFPGIIERKKSCEGIIRFDVLGAFQR